MGSIMSFDAWMWLFIFFVGAGLLFVTVYFLISFSDLECDHLNPIDLSNKLNSVVLPEYIAHTSLTAVFMLTLNIVPFILNAPLVYYHARKYMNRKHLFDSTTLITKLDSYRKEAYIKLGVYLLLFFYYMYRMVYAF